MLWKYNEIQIFGNGTDSFHSRRLNYIDVCLCSVQTRLPFCLPSIGINGKIICTRQLIILPVVLYGYKGINRAMVKSSIFWDITPCSPLKINRRFGGTCHLHLCFPLLLRWFLARLILRPWRWRQRVPPKRLTTLHYIPKHKYLHNHCYEKFKSYLEWAYLRTSCLGQYVHLGLK
jgi:hypothetical protein